MTQPTRWHRALIFAVLFATTVFWCCWIMCADCVFFCWMMCGFRAGLVEISVWEIRTCVRAKSPGAEARRPGRRRGAGPLRGRRAGSRRYYHHYHYHYYYYYHYCFHYWLVIILSARPISLLSLSLLRWSVTRPPAPELESIVYSYMACVYIYIYTYTHIHIHNTCVYIYIYIHM